MRKARDAFIRDDPTAAELALYAPGVYASGHNRLLHYYLLSSVAIDLNEYEKAAYYLLKARDLANSLRSGAGSFEWFETDYRSNPIEFSYLHYLLVLSYSLLADEGASPAWTTPEIKAADGTLLVEAQSHPARQLSPKEIADYRTRARAELLAWDSFLQALQRAYPDQKFYKNDVWARLLASSLHGASDQNSERRTAELLAADAKKILQKEAARCPSLGANETKIDALADRLQSQAKGKGGVEAGPLFVLEAGVMGQYKIRRYHLGLSTLLGQVKDPALRGMIEQIGVQVILGAAPEFGLALFTGGVLGSFDQGGEDFEEGPPHFFSDAVDRGLGFEVRFPTLVSTPPDTAVTLTLLKDGRPLPEIPLAVVAPIQEMVSTELREREDSEMFGKAVRIGLQYVAILVPAIRSYQSAVRDGNLFKRLATIAGYYLAKRAIDSANNPDLRSWNFLPQLIASASLPRAPGQYQLKARIENAFGKDERDLGSVMVGSQQLVRRRIGNVPILNHRPVSAVKP